MTTETPLSPRQVAAIEALLTHDTRAEAATAARVSERTLRRWVALPAFAAALSAARSKALDAVTTALVQGAAGCARSLVGMANGTVRATAPRVAAARAAIELARVFDERGELVTRVEQLEAEREASRVQAPRKGGPLQ